MVLNSIAFVTYNNKILIWFFGFCFKNVFSGILEQKKAELLQKFSRGRGYLYLKSDRSSIKLLQHSFLLFGAGNIRKYSVSQSAIVYRH